MKNFYALTFTILSMCFSPILLAQDTPWLEVGSEWTYQHGHVSGPEHFQFKYGITEETTLVDQPCVKMEQLEFGSGVIGCIVISDPFYFYTSNDSLFYACELDSTFRLVADFNASIGDTWKYQVVSGSEASVGVDTFLVTVTNVTTLNIESNELRQLEVNYEWLGSTFNDEQWLELYFGFPAKITEVIGGNGFFAPFGKSGVCDFETEVQFQCFQSPSFSYLNPAYDSCDQVLSIRERAGMLDLQVFPNPAREFTLVEIPEHWLGSKGAVQLHNSTGKLVFESHDYLDNRLQIPVENLTSGIYVLSISAAGESGLTKLVVE